MLKDKLRHINIFKILSTYQLESGSTKLKMAGCAPWTGAGGFYREDTEAKQGNYLIGYSLCGEVYLAACDWSFLSFIFSDSSVLLLAEVSVCFLRLPGQHERPPRSNGILV